MEENNSSLIRPLLIGLCIILVPLVIFFFLKEDSVDKGRVQNVKYELKNYQINEVIPVYITDEDLAKKYYSEYMNLMLYEPAKAFALLSDDTLLNKFDSLKSFEKYIEELKKRKGFYTATVRNYAKESENGKTVYYVMDSIGNEYGFIESTIMNYQVIIA